MTNDNPSIGEFDRRTFVKTTGAAAVAGLAGCLEEASDGNGDEDGTTDIVITTATDTTAAYAASQGVAAVVNEHTDDVYVDARPSEGTNANVGMLSREEIQMGYIQNWTANKIKAGEEPFGDLDFQPNQVFHYYDLPWLFVTGNEDWTSVTDIEADSRISPTPEGSGTAEMLEHALSYAVDGYDRISVDYGEQSGAINEGRLDAGAATFLNFKLEPSWVQEMKNTVELRILDWPENVVSNLDNDDSVLVRDVDMTGFDGYAYASDSVAAPTLSYNFVTRDDMDYDAVYAMLETMYGNREQLADQHALLMEHTDGEFWVKNPYDMPFHPAAADFYDEIGVWHDGLERGE